MNANFQREQKFAGGTPLKESRQRTTRRSALARNAYRWMRCWIAVWISSALIALALAKAADSAVTLEYKVKAGYLFNFAKFIEWPTKALPEDDSPFVIGVIDGGEAIPVLETLLQGKSVNNHPVKVKAVTAGNIGKDIHILLVTRTAEKSSEEKVQAALRGAATLLVGETKEFAERGGMVGFVREDDAIRLALNLERTTEADLKVSAKLASIAKVVKTKGTK